MSRADEHWIHRVVHWLLQDREAPLDLEVRREILSAEALELESLLNVLGHSLSGISTESKKPQILFQLLAAAVAKHAREGRDSMGVDSSTLESLYEQLWAAKQFTAAAHVLQILAMQADPDSLRVLANQLAESPPEDWQDVGVALSPLWETDLESLEEFFEALGDEYFQPSATSVLLDLANYAVRSKGLQDHPWKSKSNRLSELLQQVIYRLRKLEKSPQDFGGSVEEVQRALGDSIALTVSLCDALGLIADPSCVDTLSDALSLSHRRIQTEAAAALARIGNEEGKSRLLALGEDSVARGRVVTYAEELGFLDQLAPELRTPQALAESELSSWLADSTRFGLPPQKLELIDHRTQYWPSFEEPRDCFLFRFTYEFPQRSMSNIGIVGPLTRAFTTDLGNLPVDDIYAVFAGWQAEHEEIFEVPAAELNVAQQREAQRITQYLESLGFAELKPIALTLFFGETALLANGTREGTQVIALSDGNELVSYPAGANETSMTPEIVLCIFRGRKLLRTFNP